MRASISQLTLAGLSFCLNSAVKLYSNQVFVRFEGPAFGARFRFLMVSHAEEHAGRFATATENRIANVRSNRGVLWSLA